MSDTQIQDPTLAQLLSSAPMCASSSPARRAAAMSDPLLRNLRDPGSGTDATLLRVCWQAADEIERLQRELADARADLEHREKYWAQFDHYPKGEAPNREIDERDDPK